MAQTTDISVLHVSLGGVPATSVTSKITQEIDTRWHKKGQLPEIIVVSNPDGEILRDAKVEFSFRIQQDFKTYRTETCSDKSLSSTGLIAQQCSARRNDRFFGLIDNKFKMISDPM